MTADEIFEFIGYKKSETPKQVIYEATYGEGENTYETRVVFNKRTKVVEISSKENGVADYSGYFSRSFDKAIDLKCEELGWRSGY